VAEGLEARLQPPALHARGVRGEREMPISHQPEDRNRALDTNLRPPYTLSTMNEHSSLFDDTHNCRQYAYWYWLSPPA